MRGLLRTSVVIGILGAGLIAWESRDTVAYAAQQDREDSQADLIREFTAGCVEQLGVVKAETQAGIVHLTCRPGVGVAPVPPPVKRRPR